MINSNNKITFSNIYKNKRLIVHLFLLIKLNQKIYKMELMVFIWPQIALDSENYNKMK